MKKMKYEKLKNCGMQFITHYTERYSYLDAARMALEGGCRWVQLRMKDTPVETIEPVALEVQALCRQYGATFIIDDHVELAGKLHAPGQERHAHSRSTPDSGRGVHYRRHGKYL